MAAPMEQAEVVRVLEANRGGSVRVTFVDDEVTTSQILFVDDHLFFGFCHRIIETNRPDKHDGAYRPDTSWIARFDRVAALEVCADGPVPWGA
jgi:hypothetical protein